MIANTRAQWLEQDAASRSSAASQRFTARQPILDRGKATFGYEILFRTSWENRFTGESESASRRLIDDAICFGFNSIVGDTTPFMNCTHTILVGDLATLLPRNTVLEILETVEVDDTLISACRRLQGMGYRFALDDYDFSERWKPLLPYASFIKVDFRDSTPAQREALVRRVGRSSTQLIAEKVESDAEFRRARGEGFHLFQGYFFQKPTVLARPAPTSIMHRMRLWRELRRSELDISRVVLLLKEEAALSYRLLRFANSALAGARSQVTSLRVALVMLGTDKFRKMALVVLTSEICGAQPREVYRSLLQRARFCELMAAHTDKDATDLYLLGMLDVLKSVLELSVEDLHGLIALPTVLMDALSGIDNPYAQILRAAAALDTGNWDGLSDTVCLLGAAESLIARYWNESRLWADEVVDEASI